MDAVVRLTARGGIESVSVRTAVAEAEGIGSDLQIYRLFGGKDALLREAFLREDRGLAEEIDHRAAVLFEENLPFESRLRYLFNAAWIFLTATRREACLFLGRYYACALFSGEAEEAHREVWRPIAEKWKVLFPRADAADLVESFFSLLLNTAFAVCRGSGGSDGAAAEGGYRMLEGLLTFWGRPAGYAGRAFSESFPREGRSFFPEIFAPSISSADADSPPGAAGAGTRISP